MINVHDIGRRCLGMGAVVHGAVRLLGATALLTGLCLLLAERRAVGALLNGIVAGFAGA